MIDDTPDRPDGPQQPASRPPISDEPPIPDAQELPGTPRPAKGRANTDAPRIPGERAED